MTNHRNPPKLTAEWPKLFRLHGALATSKSQRTALYERDRGVCSYCGQKAKIWESEHEVPLHSIPPSKLEDYPACLWYWSINNLKTACLSCHKVKSAKEQTANAKVKRIIKKRTGQHKPKVGFPKLTAEQKQARREKAKQQRKWVLLWKKCHTSAKR